jgi:hypothetical protein
MDNQKVEIVPECKVYAASPISTQKTRSRSRGFRQNQISGTPTQEDMNE